MIHCPHKLNSYPLPQYISPEPAYELWSPSRIPCGDPLDDVAKALLPTALSLVNSDVDKMNFGGTRQANVSEKRKRCPTVRMRIFPQKTVNSVSELNLRPLVPQNSLILAWSSPAWARSEQAAVKIWISEDLNIAWLLWEFYCGAWAIIKSQYMPGKEAFLEEPRLWDNLRAEPTHISYHRKYLIIASAKLRIPFLAPWTPPEIQPPLTVPNPPFYLLRRHVRVSAWLRTRWRSAPSSSLITVWESSIQTMRTKSCSIIW